MANTTGKNSPSSFDEFGPTKQYGATQKANDLKKAAPVAGKGSTYLGTPRRATEIALENSRKAHEQAAMQGPPAPNVSSEPPSVTAPPVDPYQSVWQEAAQTPGASNLVREYASMA